MPRIAVDDIHLHVEQAGSGPPLLLIHGFPLSHAMWQAQLEQLADSFHVIAPDLRGFGQSDGAGEAFDMWQLADDLASLLSAAGVGRLAHVCGLSMGGYIALEFWRRHRSRLASLILCDTRAAADTEQAAAARLDTAARVLAEGPQVVADAMLAKLLAPQTSQRRPQTVAAVRQMMLDTSPAAIAAALRGMARRDDFTAMLPEIDVPTLLVCGEHDAISPPDEMQGVAAAIPGARFVPIPAAGHLAPLENPPAVNAAVRQFLQAAA